MRLVGHQCLVAPFLTFALDRAPPQALRLAAGCLNGSPWPVPGAAAAPEKPKVEPEGGFLTFLLTALGLTGAALAGLATGFAQAYIKAYTNIFTDFTKLVRVSFNLLLKPFTVFTDFIKRPFVEGGSIRKLFSEAIDKLKPQFIDDIVKNRTVVC